MSVAKWIHQLYIVAILSVCVQPIYALNEAMYTQDEYEIKDHMRVMYDLKDQIFSKLEEEDLISTADIISLLRSHLHSVMPKEPNKIKGLPDRPKRELMIQYQKYIAQVILITLELEETVLKEAANELEKAIKDDKIKDLVTNMLKTISLGHKQFR